MKKLLLLFGVFTFFNVNAQQIFQDFESGTFPPTGWDESHTGVDALNQSTAQAYSGTYSALFDDDFSVDTSRLSTDTITSLNATSQLTFWQYQDYDTYYEYHAIWISVNGAPATELVELGVGTDEVWEEQTVDLSAYAGQKIALTFVYYGNFADEWYVDDIKVDLIPTCPELSNLSSFLTGTDSTNLTWIPEPTDSAWIIQYDTAGFSLGTGTTVNSGNDSVTINGLTPDVTYDFYVRGICTVGDTGNWVGPITVTTLETCPALSGISSYLVGTDSTNLTWTPGLNDSAWIVQYDTAGFSLGTGTVVNAGNDSITLNGLTPSTSYEVYVRGICTVGDTGEWVGPFIVNTLATCPALTSPYAYLPGTDSVNITWLAGANDTAWQLQYGVSGFAPGSGVYVSSSNDTITLNGLMSGTTYDVYVRGVCGIGDTGVWVGPVTFPTQCSFYVAPWTEEFNTTPPNCFTEAGDNAWEYGSVSGTTPTGFADYGAATVMDYSASGTGTFIGMDGSDNVDGDTSSLESPLVDVSALAIPALSYAVFSNNVDDAAQNKLIVEFYDGATWNPLDTIQANLGNNWVWMEYDLSSYSITGNVQARFTVIGVSNGGDSYYNDILIDNISFNQFITCPSPDSLSLVSFGTDSITFEYVEGASDSTWVVQYDTTGFTLGTGNVMNVNNDTVTINSLNPDTAYDIYIRSVCTVGDSSAWVGPLTVTTLAKCPVPSTISDYLIARDSNNITWTPGVYDSLWQIEYDTTGFTLGTGVGTQVTNDSTSLNSLTPNTTYDVYLRSICTSLDTSKWVGPFTFTTLPSCPTVDSVYNFYTTDDSTNIVIVSGPYDSSWQVEYGTAGFTPGSGTLVNSGNDTLPLNGLTVNTDYDVYVKSICSVGDTSIWYGPYNFSTLCAVYTPTYLEDFTTFLPTCWEDATGSLTVNSSLSSGGSDWGQSAFGNAGSNDAASLNLYSSSHNEWLISPTIDLGDGSNPYILELDIALTGYNSSSSSTFDADDRVVVLISTDNGATWSDTNSLVTFDNTSTITNTGDHILYDLSADGYTGLVKFAVYAESKTYTADNDVFIDNFAINPRPSCLQATNLNAYDIGADSAYLTWSGSASDSVYIVEYGPAGFTPGTGTTVNSVNDTLLVTGLMGSTNYDFYVTVVCSITDTSLVSVKGNFSTQILNPSNCGLNFQLADNTCGASNKFPVIVNSAPGTMLGTDVIVKEVRLIVEHTFDGDLDMSLVSPSGDTVELSSDNGGSGANYGDTTGGCTQYTSFTMNASTSVTAGSAPFIGQYLPEDNFNLFYDNSSPIGKWELILCDDAGGDVGALHYVEIVLDLPPTCPRPTNFTAYGAGTDSVNLAWTQGASDSTWIIEYGPVGYTPGTGTIVNANNDSVTINGLSPDTEYDFYLRSVCTVGDSSIWVGPAVDTTLPLCLKPLAFTVLTSDSNSINVGWNTDPVHASYIVEYGPAGFTPGTGTTATIAAPNNFYQATGLNSLTDYDFYIRSVCLSGDSSVLDGPYAGKTSCGNGPASLPYTEDFTTWEPICWSLMERNLATDPVFTDSTSSDWFENGFANSGSTGAATLNIYGTTFANDWLISPSIDLGSDPSRYRIVEFDVALNTYASTSSGVFGVDDTLAVIISPDNGLTWDMANAILVFDTANTPSNTGDHIYYELTGYSGVVKFAFYGVSTVSNEDNDVHIDNFSVRDSAYVGVNELNAISKSFNIYPNPNNGEFKLRNSGNAKQTVVSIMDIQGREVFTDKISFSQGEVETLNLNNAEKGLYIVTIQYNGIKEQHRVIID